MNACGLSIPRPRWRPNGDGVRSVQPFAEMRGDEFVVLPLRVSQANPIDLFQLTGREVFCGIETPAAGHQPLATENFVKTGDASRKRMLNIDRLRWRR